MKRKLLLFLSFFVTMTMMADPVTKDEAAQKAQAFINGKNKQRPGGPRRVKLAHRQMKLVQAAQENALYYVFNVGEEDGFVIVSGDDRTPAVLGYTDNGSFSTDQMPDNMRAWLQGYADQIAWLQEHPEEQNTIQKAPTKNVIIPLIQTQWNQDAPYNLQCPTDPTTGKTCVTGCVATAMAQVMYYHRWPEATTTQIPAYTTEKRGISISAIAAGTTFDWDNMIPIYGNTATAAQKNAVAKLMAACGAAVQMDYASSASGANVSGDDFINYFGYSETAHEIFRENYSFAEWNSLIYAELVEGRPVLYGGQSSGGGHQFVVDGYDGDELFHVNWGWGGGSDGYFLLSVLNPHSTNGIGASSSNDGYSFGQSAVIGVKPYDGETLLTEVKMTSSINSVSGYEIDCSYRNYAGGTYSFDFGIGFLNEDGSISAISSYSYNNLGQGWGFSSWPFSVPNSTISSLADGIYKIVPISKENGTETWYSNVDKKEYVEVVVENGNATLSIHKAVMALQATSFNYSGSKKAGTEQPVDVTIQNLGDEFYGVLYLFASTTNTKGSYQSRSGVTIIENKSIDTQFTFTPTVAGTYNIWICTDASGNNVIGQSSVEIEEASSGNVNLSHVSTVFETVSGNKMLGTSIKGTATIKNNSSDSFYGSLRVWVMRLEDDGYYHSFGKRADVTLNIAAGGTAEMTYEFSDLTLGEKYLIAYYYGSSGITNYQAGSFTCIAAVEAFEADGTRFIKEATSTLNIEDDVCALNLTGVSGVTSVTGGNPNTLFIFGENDNVPASLAGRNVVKGSTAASIMLEDGYDFYSPVTFTATEATYTRTFAAEEGLTRDYQNWSTLTLPFDVSSVTVELNENDYPIDWFHSGDESGKNFWVMDFSYEENGVVNFGHAQNIIAGRPCLLAVPGAAWGNANDLTGLPITFHGSNVSISGDFRAATSGDNYKMKGVVAQKTLSNIYALNATGSAFTRENSATVDAFRAYFEPTSTAANASMLMMAFGGGNGGGTTALGVIDRETVSNSGWYSLDGQKLNGQPVKKGIYIVNGKKVVIK
ncbi:MAG: C10 family peptidase [Prevotella sp.]|nr:C10 family peptidase [Prevotella sp.]